MGIKVVIQGNFRLKFSYASSSKAYPSCHYSKTNAMSLIQTFWKFIENQNLFFYLFQNILLIWTLHLTSFLSYSSDFTNRVCSDRFPTSLHWSYVDFSPMGKMTPFFCTVVMGKCESEQALVFLLRHIWKSYTISTWWTGFLFCLASH